ncbi:MAG TPA: glycosyltransferase [Tepidisphaeraceae bacterium]|nr:glycosyltransferase [Tepidisphaeraceae bacterium]
MSDVALTVVLNAMGRLELADLGFRSWMLQKWDQPYEVVLSLFNDQQARYEALTQGKNPNCRVTIRSYDRPAFFNISAANNLGLHFASGDYVMFANSDVVYPSSYGQRFINNMLRHRCGCAVGSRYNLNSEQTTALKSAAEYTHENNFDFLDAQWSYVGGPPIWYTCGPWVIRRDVARAIGCFDPAVLVSEDDDLTSRAVHYLAKQGEQDSNMCFLQMMGFHLYHSGSELFDAHHLAHQIIDPRRDRMRAKFDSREETIPNRLDDLNWLVQQVRETKKPSPLAKYRQNTFRKISGRITAAAKILIARR